MYNSREYKAAKRKVLKELLAAGWGFALAEWTRESGEQLRANSEGYDETDKHLAAYDYYSTDYNIYPMQTHVDLEDIARKHGCFWEPINGAETGLCLV